jgi:hypothetical protein
MEAHICCNCGTQYLPYTQPPHVCKICRDERFFVRWGGQEWTTVSRMREEGYRCEIHMLEQGLYGVGVSPAFGAGRRALVITTPNGNVLWDATSYFDNEAIDAISSIGGIQAIAVSDPHCFAAMVDWSRVFSDAPIYVAEDDKDWIMRPCKSIRFFRGRKEILPNITLVQCGGHFPGSSVLLWSDTTGNRGVLCLGNTIHVAMDRRHVGFMYSYPNLVPLSATAVGHTVESLAGLSFDRMYGDRWGRNIVEGAKSCLFRSAERHLQHVRQPPD